MQTKTSKGKIDVKGLIHPEVSLAKNECTMALGRGFTCEVPLGCVQERYMEEYRGDTKRAPSPQFTHVERVLSESAEELALFMLPNIIFASLSPISGYFLAKLSPLANNASLR